MTIHAPSVGQQSDAPFSAPGYAITPNAVLRDTRLSTTARLLYSLLDGRRAAGPGKSKGIRVSVATLAADLGCAESTVRRVAGELEDAGWLARRRTGRTSSWALTNPVRTGKTASKITALERTLDGLEVGSVGSADQPLIAHQRADSLTEPRVGRLEASNEGGTAGGPLGHGARAPISERSDRSSASALQSITREDYNSTAAQRPVGPQAPLRGTGSDQPSSPTSASASREQRDLVRDQDMQEHAKSPKAARAAASGWLLPAYLDEINAATGAKLRPSPQLRELVDKIAARAILPDEAALTAAAWLAVKGGKIKSPEGFLASVVLPSLAEGQGLDVEPAKPTPTPPAYRELAAQPRCQHGAEQGRCALCRRSPSPAEPSEPSEPTAAAEIHPDLAAALSKLGAPR